MLPDIITLLLVIRHHHNQFANNPDFENTN